MFAGWVEKNAGLWVDESDKSIRQDLKPKALHGNWAFHYSWDALRPVMEKCWNLTTEDEREFEHLSLFELGLFSDIEIVWTSVIEFIEWYERKNKQNG